MRATTGNPFNEAHGKDLRLYEWILPAGTNVHDAITRAEGALGLSLGSSDPVDGFIYAVRFEDGVYFSVHLYDTPCPDACPVEHELKFRVARPVANPTLVKMRTDIGEHAQYKLTGNDEADMRVLVALGFHERALSIKTRA